jgi:hypothetical protein
MRMVVQGRLVPELLEREADPDVSTQFNYIVVREEVARWRTIIDENEDLRRIFFPRLVYIEKYGRWYSNKDDSPTTPLEGGYFIKLGVFAKVRNETIGTLDDNIVQLAASHASAAVCMGDKVNSMIAAGEIDPIAAYWNTTFSEGIETDERGELGVSVRLRHDTRRPLAYYMGARAGNIDRITRRLGGRVFFEAEASTW